jgi:hypothetical protein
VIAALTVGVLASVVLLAIVGTASAAQTTIEPAAAGGAGGKVTGRMTGGGTVVHTSVHFGFVLQCDRAKSPNHLQITWGKGKNKGKFHLTSMLSAACSDDPSISEGQPVAGFDTYRGSGIGKYNGISGATAGWVATDAGEPGKNDTLQITIKDAAGNTVLTVSGRIRGNEQAHPGLSSEGTSGLTLEKLQRIADSGSFTQSELTAKVGETVNYEVIAKNTGATTLTLSNFSDPNCTNIVGGKSSLAPGESATWTCEHKLSASGKYTNSASVEANEGVGKKESNAVTVNATSVISGLTVEKLQRVGSSGSFTQSELTAKVGETVTYEIVVTNTGATTLSLSNFSDAKCTNISGGASSLEAGKSTTWLCEHKLTEGGKYTNSASVEANEGVGKKESNAVTVNAEQVTGACEPSSSLAALIFGKDVLSYVPKGSWINSTTGVSVVNVEGSAITPAKIETKSPVNSCASNSATGVTVCTANNADVYIIKGAKIEHELTSGGSGAISFSGGSCTNCGVAMDSAHNRALISLAIESKPGFQFLNLDTLTFEKPFAAASGEITENPLIDPTRELILSPAENGVYEVVNVTKASEPAFFENKISGEFDENRFLDSAGEDCSTGIALSTSEGTSNLYLADLTQAKFTPGSPAGTWTAPSQFQTLAETSLSAGTSGVAVAQGTHTGVVAGEFGGKNISAISLPETSGSGTPTLKDYVTCAIGTGFELGLDPHTVTAYKSPNGGDAIGLFTNSGGGTVAVVDLTKMLNPSIVKRTAGGHACEAGTLPEEVESFISVP